MADEPIEVEVLDRNGRPVLPVKKSVLKAPLDALIFLCAMLAAFGILLIAIGQVLQERARELGHKDGK